MSTAREINWDRILNPDALEEVPVSAINITFYSDTNLMNAHDELEMLQLDTLQKDGKNLTVSAQEYAEMEEPIQVIVDAWGGHVEL